MDGKGNYNDVVTLHPPPPPPPLVCLLCAWSDLISSLHRKGQAIERRKARYTSVGIKISKSSPPTNSSNTKVPIAKGSQHYPKCHLSVSSIHSRATETSSLILQPQFFSKARLLFYLQMCLLLLLILLPQFLRKERLLFCLQTFLRLCLSLQPQLLSNTCLIFWIQMCLLFCLGLHPHLLSNARLLFSHQLCKFFLPRLHPCFFRNARLLFKFQL